MRIAAIQNIKSKGRFHRIGSHDEIVQVTACHQPSLQNNNSLENSDILTANNFISVSCSGMTARDLAVSSTS